MTDPTGRTAARDNARAELRDADGDVLAEYLQWDDALGAATLPAIMTEIVDHPALAPLLAQTPAPEPATAAAPVLAIVLAKPICELNNGHKPFFREDGQRQWHTACLAIQRLIFIAHGYHLAWYGEPLVDEQFQMWGKGLFLASLRALPGWKFAAEEVERVMSADTSVVTKRQRAVVAEIVRAHGTWGLDLDERLASWPVVVDGDFSQAAIHAYFLGLVSRKERSTVQGLATISDRADVIETMLDEDTKAELLRRWLTVGTAPATAPGRC